MSDKTTGNEGSVKKKGGVLIPVTCVCCTAAIIATIILTNGNGGNTTEQKEPEKRQVVLNEENIEEAIQEFEEQDYVGFGAYRVSMVPDWKFIDGTSPSYNAYVENLAVNTNDVYFDVIRSDTNETIYESPIIPLGSYLKGITLNKDLEAGTYDCVMEYHLINENQETLSTLSVTLKIIVEN